MNYVNGFEKRMRCVYKKIVRIKEKGIIIRCYVCLRDLSLFVQSNTSYVKKILLWCEILLRENVLNLIRFVSQIVLWSHMFPIITYHDKIWDRIFFFRLHFLLQIFALDQGLPNGGSQGNIKWALPLERHTNRPN